MEAVTNFFVVWPNVDVGEDVFRADLTVPEQKFLIPEFRCCHDRRRLLRAATEIQTCLARRRRT